MSFIKLTDLDLAGKRVLIRSDLNVPVKDGKVTSDARITASMPTFEHCLKAGAKVMVMSHLGRPEEGVYSEENSLAPVAADLSAKMGREVRLVKDYLESAPEVADGELVLLENVRFNKGEKKDDEAVQAVRRALRRLCHGRLRHRPPRPGLDPRRRQVRARRLCRPAAGRGAGRPEQGPGRARPAHGRHRRRLQGLHQADRARGPVREGRPARGRRRHRQHLPQGRRPQRRQVPVRGRPGRHRQGPDGEDDRPRRHHPDRHRRGLRQEVRRERAGRAQGGR
jgi:hypothetical protein